MEFIVITLGASLAGLFIGGFVYLIIKTSLRSQ